MHSAKVSVLSILIMCACHEAPPSSSVSSPYPATSSSPPSHKPSSEVSSKVPSSFSSDNDDSPPIALSIQLHVMTLSGEKSSECYQYQLRHKLLALEQSFL